MSIRAGHTSKAAVLADPWTSKLPLCGILPGMECCSIGQMLVRRA
jgi:hypothetical protein